MCSFKRLCGPNTRLVNSYGLTEATIDSTWFEASDDTELLPGRFVPIGGALDNTKVYVLDAEPRAPADRDPRRAVRGRRGGGARLSEPTRADRRALRPDPFEPRQSRARSCIGRATWRAGSRTARSTSSAGPTARSRSAVSGSSLVRSRPCSSATRACARPRSSTAPTRAGRRAWSATSSRWARLQTPGELRAFLGRACPQLHGSRAPSPCWRSFPTPPTARLTAMRCRSRSGTSTPARRTRFWPRAPRRSAGWLRSGARSCRWTRSASRTTSSPWAVIR